MAYKVNLFEELGEQVDANGSIKINASAFVEVLTLDGSTAFKEQSSAPTNTADFGKFYTKTSDGLPYWLTAAGVEYNLAATGSGDVLKTGTPVDNQLAIWNASNTIEGDAGLTWTGTNFLASTSADANVSLTRTNTHAGTGAKATIESVNDTAQAITMVMQGSNFATSPGIFNTGSLGTLGTASTAGLLIHAHDNVGKIEFATGGTALVNIRARVTSQGAWELNEIATPTTPASGYGAIYFKSDGKLYVKNDAGTETDLQAVGSGDVSKVGTPVNDQLAVWTGDGTLKGSPSILFQDSGNKRFRMGDGNLSDVSTLFNLISETDGQMIRVQRSSADAQAGSMDFYKSRGDSTTPAIVLNNDTLGGISFSAFDGSLARNTSQILGQMDGVPGSSDVPGRLVFYTVPDGSTTLTQRMRINSEGAVWINEITTPSTPDSGFGAVYFKSDGKLYAQNDAGTETDLQATGSGNVSKVGTPLNNQIGIWTGDGTIEGDAKLTFDGTNLEQKSHAAFAGSGHFQTTNAIQTTTATTTTLHTLNLADNTVYWVEAHIIGRDTSGTDRAFYTRSVMVYREAAGSAVLGSVETIVTDETNTNWNATFDVTGNDIRVRVTGAAATTINWTCTLRSQGVSGNA